MTESPTPHPPLPAPLVHTPAWDEAVSAMADGEEPGFDPRIVQAHLDKCARCRAVGAAPAGIEFSPDFAERVARRVADEDRAAAGVVLRLLLGAVGVFLLLNALPDLVEGHDGGMTVHAARHLGSFTAAYGAGLLVVAARPARARTMLPVSVVLGVALLITAVIDVLDGHVPLIGEARHLPELATVGLLYLLARNHGGGGRTVGS